MVLTRKGTTVDITWRPRWTVDWDHVPPSYIHPVRNLIDLAFNAPGTGWDVQRQGQQRRLVRNNQYILLPYGPSRRVTTARPTLGD